jgi:hypothetical protein
MRKSVLAAVLTLCAGLLLYAPQARSADTPEASYSALSKTFVDRAQAELTRTQALVDQGVLPKSRLIEAHEKLADAQDQATLAITLYERPRIEDMTPEQARAMLSAAQRRVDREQQTLERRRQLLETGILSQSEFSSDQDELESRKQVLALVQARIQLMNELQQMAATEQRFERLSQDASAALKAVMIRYSGSAQFDISELSGISRSFEQHFHHALPVSAIGETALHRSMGLDHRNRVDVALSPDSAEGIWLRHLLEQLQVPYLAFRAALAGAATAPHIHIGLESTRLKLARR